MNIKGIQKNVLSLLIQIGKDSYPHEFLAQLLHKDGIINDVLIIPGTITSPVMAYIRDDVRPIMVNLAGTAHSHPNGILRPSFTDVLHFAKIGGQCHLIFGSPFSRDSWRAFHADGSPYTLYIVGDDDWDENG
ncbi:MAG: Mov34/MPN/PAD-1 family protein [Methanomicrobiales archaeon]|jgi:proteasome lid subunit RPN8/RPN11|nr:Mov34/MPN/PAD-1 family protein [Methanomicrobiales archaeon]